MVNGIGGQNLKLYTMDATFDGTITKQEAIDLAQTNGITLKEADLPDTLTSEDYNRLVAQTGKWSMDITTMWQTKTTGNKEQTIAGLKTQYANNDKFTGDIYSMNNPQLQAFQKFLDDGVIEELGKTFTRTDIVDIVSQVFPNIGVSLTGNSDEYTIPWGHEFNGQEKGSKAVYDKFREQITKASGNVAQITELENQLNGKVNQLNTNVRNTGILSSQANTLKDEITKIIEDAIRESEKIEEQCKKDADEAVKTELTKYSNSKGKMTYSQFESNVSKALAAIDPTERLSNVVAQMLSAEAKVGTLKDVVGRIGNLNTKNTQIRQDMGEINKQINDLRVQDAQNAEKEVKRTDPIGFKLASGVQLDFFMDKDNDNLISNEQEFLGAENGWNEMTALDTSGDSIVDYAELAAQQNLKVVITNTDGSQEIKNIADIFKQGDSINLNSYNAKGTMIDGTDNILAGTFTVNKDGAELEGYQTFDTLDYLDANYSFSDAANGKGRFAQGVINALEGVEVLASEFDQIIAALETKLSDGNTAIGNTKTNMQDYVDNGAFNDQVKANAKEIEAGFNAKTKGTSADTENDTFTVEVESQYETYKSSLWDADMTKLRQANTTRKYNEARTALMTRLKSANYSPEDTLRVLNDIRDAVAQSLHIRLLAGTANTTTLFQDAATHEEEAYEIAQNTGESYEKHEFDPTRGEHKKPKKAEELEKE